MNQLQRAGEASATALANWIGSELIDSFWSLPTDKGFIAALGLNVQCQLKKFSELNS